MPRYIRTQSFTTGRSFDSEKDDAKVNELLERLQAQGAEILDIQVKLAGRETGATSVYLIQYEAPSPL